MKATSTQPDTLHLTQQQAAEQAGVSVRTIRRLWQEDGAFETRKMRGRRMVVRQSFLRWLESLPG